MQYTISLLTNQFVDRFKEGGPFFMTLILICLLLSIFLLVKGFLSLKKDAHQAKKMISLTTDTSLLGLVIGFFASVIGLITAFDSVEALGDPNPAIFAGGLKVSLLTATFGLFTFIIARIGILILRWLMHTDKS
ncbi:MotA/TolQ/ExbB proton channel family protein [Winogradskyella sp.]|uniref:MotA/TolQ/ExbB proton channel family protein n=1 Tax=Winogradskyella sp. TaxID=1883156 RepID=UPI00261D4E71|nr:MotA/TolQ/ExbB proton channel family protein [Winogradskyella sp.]